MLLVGRSHEPACPAARVHGQGNRSSSGIYPDFPKHQRKRILPSFGADGERSARPSRSSILIDSGRQRQHEHATAQTIEVTFAIVGVVGADVVWHHPGFLQRTSLYLGGSRDIPTSALHSLEGTWPAPLDSAHRRAVSVLSRLRTAGARSLRPARSVVSANAPVGRFQDWSMRCELKRELSPCCMHEAARREEDAVNSLLSIYSRMTGD